MRIPKYLFDVIRFSTKASPWAIPVLLLAVIGTIVEFAALSLLVPLTQSVNHSHASLISRAWSSMVARIGIAPDPKIWFELFVAMMLVRVILQFAYSALTSSVSRDVSRTISAGAFHKFVVETSLLEIQRHKIGHFIAIAGDEAMRAGQIFLYFSQLLVSLLAVLVTTAAMVVFSPNLAAGVAIFVVLTGVAVLQSTRHVYRLGSVVKHESRIATSTFLDGLNGLRSVRAVGGEQYVVNQYKDQITKYQRTLFRVDFTTHAQKNLPLIILLLLVIALLVGVSSETILHLDLASTVASMILMMRFFPSAGACLSNGMKLLSDLRAAHDVVWVADTAPVHAGPPRNALTGPIRDIELSNVNYRYDENSGPVLRNLSFVFRCGFSYAICGPSGSGKSTLVDLILGLIPNEELDIRINGAPLRELDQGSYRRRMVLVEQQSRIFNDTVRNNIVFGLEASEEDILKAVRLAGFDQVLDALPNGIETVLDYQGTNLSGGQRQRLGIARALLRNPEVLILDESTSALDAAMRDAVLGNILAHFHDRIVIVVTHDSTVIARMDKKLVLEPRPAHKHTDASSELKLGGQSDEAVWPDSLDDAGAI
jgi:ABC-type multidrug transport system fused ATPase/permease subunit